jgi:hypothetical protein
VTASVSLRPTWILPQRERGRALTIALVATLTSTAGATVDSITTPDPGEEDLSRPEITRTTLTQGNYTSMQLDADGFDGGRVVMPLAPSARR